MPTEAQIKDARADLLGSLKKASATVEVSEEDAAIIREYEEYASGCTKTLTERGEPIPHDVRSIGRLCALARRGAGKAVPDRKSALRGVAVTKRMVEAAQSTYEQWEEYGLIDEDMAAAIKAALTQAVADMRAAPKPKNRP